MNFAKAAESKNGVMITSHHSSYQNRSYHYDSGSRIEVKDGYNLYIMRGLPGSGKSSLSNQILQAYQNNGKKAFISSADDFFVNQHTGRYIFDASRLEEAHDWCHKNAAKHMKKEFAEIYCYEYIKLYYIINNN